MLQGQSVEESSVQMLTQFTSEISAEMQTHREEQRTSRNFRHLENFNVENTDVYRRFLQSHEGLKIIISCLSIKVFLQISWLYSSFLQLQRNDLD